MFYWFPIKTKAQSLGQTKLKVRKISSSLDLQGDCFQTHLKNLSSLLTQLECCPFSVSCRSCSRWPLQGVEAGASGLSFAECGVVWLGLETKLCPVRQSVSFSVARESRGRKLASTEGPCPG